MRCGNDGERPADGLTSDEREGASGAAGSGSSMTVRTSTGDHGPSPLIPLSLAEIRRLIHRVTDRRPTPVDHILHWSIWRRRRQHQARISHYKRRGHSP